MHSHRRTIHVLLIAVLGLFPLACAQSMSGPVLVERTLCTAEGETTVTVVVDPGDDHTHHDGYDSRCPWCGAATDASAVVRMAMVPLPAPRAIGVPRTPARAGEQRRGHLPQPRAPPGLFPNT